MQTLPSFNQVGSVKEVALGTEHTFNGILYRYVKAGEAISTTVNEPYALCVDAADLAMKATAALGLAGNKFGAAPRLIIPINYYFWARMRGVFPLRVTAAAAVTRLGIGGVGAAGRLMSGVTASAGNVVVEGLLITAAASASASAGNTIRTAIATWPVFTTAVAD